MSLWLPSSTCGPDCLPAEGSVARVHPGVVLARTAGALALVLLAGAALCVLPLMSQQRRVSATRAFCRAVLRALGVRHSVTGRLPRRGALVVANHVSWLDILVVLAHAPARLLAKHEVRRWPVVGAMAASCGTVFIDRTRPRTLPATVAEVSGALRAGGVVAVFPEGTTWCGRSSGPFRPAMFQAAIDAGAPVVPVTLRFQTRGTPTTVAAFVGDDTLLASFRRVVTTRGLEVALTAQPALHPAAQASRHALAYIAMYRVVDTMPGCGPSTSPVGSGLPASTRPGRDRGLQPRAAAPVPAQAAH
jgi:1-acyl-sn-glycerol-3-phosphate acyltransferase